MYEITNLIMFFSLLIDQPSYCTICIYRRVFVQCCLKCQWSGCLAAVSGSVWLCRHYQPTLQPGAEPLWWYSVSVSEWNSFV